ncbi:SGNH/GDSL hydrolase family protein [Sphingomonas jatrophae]|uniref:GDSL-like Lipase/Acylhydrolase family protein n=1 Tax=Sphingomonas jatrophae TaxID=1166337 RepID=A0A1I6M590_9SPHN|nr:SGNH/GDSL hydrolase family protein [Sphingomonas jatrophae]SFS10895.1 GDSL-like Lipase/Acylhydrolase family protein [Sphingomonas jatrophae]
MLSTLLPAASPAMLAASMRGARLLRVARAAHALNPRNAGPYAGPSTITDNGAAIPTQTSAAFPFTAAAPGVWTTNGGRPFSAGGAFRFQSATIFTSGGNGGLNDGKNVNFWRATANVHARYLAVKLYPTAASYRFIVDGRYVSPTGTVLATTTGGTAQHVLLDFATRGLRQVTIEGQGTCGFGGAYVEPTGKVFPVDTSEDVRLAFLGDSYVYGSAASHLADGLVPVMADWLGMRALASGSGGTGWNQTNQATAWRFDQRIAQGDLSLDTVPPDVIALMASVNDRLRDSAVVQANALTGLQTARALHPGVPILVFGCVPIPNGPLTGTPSLTSTEQAVQAAVTTFADPLCRFVPVTLDPAGAWSTGTGAIGAETGSGNADWLFVADKTHLSDEGCAAMGRRYAAAALGALGGMLGA